MKRLSSVWAVLGLTAALAGCQEKPKPVAPPPPPPPLSAAQQRTSDAGQFRAALTRYDAHLAGLPGRSEADHRTAAASVLADLNDALRAAYGGRPSPGYANDVAIVAAAAQVAATPDAPATRVEAAENEALQAAIAGLREVAARVLYDDAALPALIDTVDKQAAVARASQGPQHDGDITAGFQSLALVLRQVDAGLQERFANPTGAADPTPPAPVAPPMPVTPPAPPATEPTTAPTTAPATTMPTTAP